MFMEEKDLEKIKNVIVNLDKVDDATANTLRKAYGIEELDPNRPKVEENDDDGVKDEEDMEELD